MTHGTIARADACRRWVGRCAALGALALVGAALAPRAAAQAWNYPAMHPPHMMLREYNFAIASGGDAGTSILAQWREDIGLGLELNLEGGLADPKVSGFDARLFLGAGLAGPVWRASPTLPLDILVAGGIYPSFGDPGTIIRIPVGVSVGHRFPLAGGFAITPYVHPRVSLDFCRGDDCSGGDESDIAIDFDFGGDFELNPHLSFRAAVLFSGSNSFGLLGDSAFGVSLSWKPTALAGR
jgi:hypothetical protein